MGVQPAEFGRNSLGMEPKTYRDPQSKRILWVGIIVSVVVLAAIFIAVLSMNPLKGSGAFTGKVIAKEFTPAPAQEITIGKIGLQSERVEGEYLLKVQTPDGSRVFNVWVDKVEYDNFKVGDDYFVLPTP